MGERRREAGKDGRRAKEGGMRDGRGREAGNHGETKNYKLN